MNNREAMQKAFEGQKFKVFSPFKCDISKNEDGNYVDDETIFAFAWFCRGIASQAQQPDRITDVGETMQEPYAYDVPTQDGTELAYAIYYTKYNNPLPEDAIPLYTSQQEPSKDIHEAITLLSAVFDAWENGTDCYDDFDGVSGSFIGKAFNLDDEIFKRCCDLLNRVNPPRNVSQAQQTESKWISVDERLPEMAQKVFGIYDAGMCAFMRVRSEDDTWCWAIGRNDLYDDFFYDADDDYQVTHWMPLPPAPEGDKTCEK